MPQKEAKRIPIRLLSLRSEKFLCDPYHFIISVGLLEWVWIEPSLSMYRIVVVKHITFCLPHHYTVCALLRARGSHVPRFGVANWLNVRLFTSKEAEKV